MDSVFLQILNMSTMASIVIIFVILARVLLKKAPKSISYCLWSLVLIRLVCPFTLESFLSIMPPASSLPSSLQGDASPLFIGTSHSDNVTSIINMQADSFVPASAMQICAWAWLSVMVALIVFNHISYIVLAHRLGTAVRLKDNIYECEHRNAPFVLGVFRPRIYLPNVLRLDQRHYILMHEKAHIKRLDYLVKPIAFTVLCVHWFNPLVWLAFILMNKDMEMSCDEAVLKANSGARQAYSETLLSLATKHRGISVSSLAFGESNVKARIKNALNYKRPSFWIVAVCVFAIIILAVCVLTNPIKSEEKAASQIEPTGSSAASPVDSSRYDITDFPNGDIQLAISNISDYSEFAPQNEGFVFYEKAQNKLHGSIVTGIGQPQATSSSPVGSLAGASVNFEVDMLARTLLSSEYTLGANGEKLDINDERLLDICMSLYNKAVSLSTPIEASSSPSSVSISPQNRLETINSLDNWQAFNYDGKISKNCYNFFYDLLSGKSDIPEYNSVIINDYTISYATDRADEFVGLNFDFTVEQSGLKALPKGKYHKVVEDIVDCYLNDSLGEQGADFRGKFKGIEQVDMVANWIGSIFVWDCPDFGKAKFENVNYLVKQYGTNGELRADEYVSLCKSKFGIAADITRYEGGLLIERDGVKYLTEGGLGGASAYEVVDYRHSGDIGTVRVQFYADCNSLLPSHLVEYRIKDSGIWLGYDMISEAKYEPYQLQQLFS